MPMLPGPPSGMHPAHPISNCTGDPIPREQQILRLSKADIRILGKRRQRQRLRRLPQRPHQHPRRPSARTTTRIGGIRAGTTTSARVPRRLEVDDRKVLAGG
ncbi:hypothetical protein [Microbispora rosea]|uniref:hypothetical protein n=1 Tax=Microbispora rosea TaxID=58117 RepID=UPI003D928D23